MESYMEIFERTMNKEKIDARLNAGEHPIALVIEKYNLIKIAVINDERVPDVYYKSDFCALCHVYNSYVCKNTDMIKCPLYVKTGIVCEIRNSSLWGNIYNSRENKEDHIYYINELINTCKIILREDFKTEFSSDKITERIKAGEDCVQIAIERYNMFITCLKTGIEFPYSLIDPINDPLCISVKLLYGKLHTCLTCKFNPCYNSGGPQNIAYRNLDKNITVEQKIKMIEDIIEWIKETENKTEEKLNLGVLFDGDIPMNAVDVKVMVTNVMSEKGVKLQKIDVEGLRTYDKRNGEFDSGYPSYSYIQDDANSWSLRVYGNNYSDRKEIVKDNLYPPEFVTDFIEALRAAVKREREIIKKVEKEREEWNGISKVIII